LLIFICVLFLFGCTENNSKPTNQTTESSVQSNDNPIVDSNTESSVQSNDNPIVDSSKVIQQGNCFIYEDGRILILAIHPPGMLAV